MPKFKYSADDFYPAEMLIINYLDGAIPEYGAGETDNKDIIESCLLVLKIVGKEYWNHGSAVATLNEKYQQAKKDRKQVLGG